MGAYPPLQVHTTENSLPHFALIVLEVSKKALLKMPPNKY